MEFPKSWRCEILINNMMIEKDFQAALLPFNLVNLVLCLPKYYIRDNFITPNGIVANAIICFGGLLLCLFNVYRLYDSFPLFYFSFFLFVTRYGDLVVQICGYILNSSLTILYSTIFVEMVSKLHRSYRFLHDYDDKSLNNILFWNWFHTLSLMCYYILLAFILMNIIVQVQTYEFFCMWLVFIFDFNLIFGSGVLKMVRLNFFLWICKVKKNNESIDNDIQMDLNYWQQMYTVYVELLESYNLYKKIFEAMLLFHIFLTFMESLFKVQTWIWLGKSMGGDSYFLVVSLINDLIWIPKSFLLEVMHSIQCEKLYEVVRQSQEECAMQMASENSTDKRRMYKNVMRVHRATFSKMRASGLAVDATLPLQYLALLTRYTVVLLQFAFN